MGKILWGVLGLAGILLVLSCEDDKGSGSGGLPTEVRRAAEVLLDSLQIDASAEVYVVGPLPGGTVLREFVPDTLNDTAAVLTLPNHSGAMYGFFINDQRLMSWSHPVRYAWVATETGSVGRVDARWPMFVDLPSGAESPFAQSAEETLEGVTFRFGTGGGSLHEQETPGKPADTLGGPIRQERIEPSGRLDAPCKKIGFVFDGGEWSDMWGKEGFSAGAMADNASLVNTFLTDNGFAVTRISQYAKNTLPGYFATNGDLAGQLRRTIENFATQFECPCDGDPGCHEFFLYICAHGDSGTVTIYEPGKTGWGWFKYSELNTWLSRFPPCVKVIVFLDICKAGSAQTALAGQCNTRGDCGFTLITTCDASNSTPSGLGPTDSGTEDWAEAHDEDYDDDGRIGDLGDRWLNLEDENSSYNPTRFMCPGQTSMCSTD